MDFLKDGLTKRIIELATEENKLRKEMDERQKRASQSERRVSE